MAPTHDSLHTRTSSSSTNSHARSPSATQVLTRTLLAVKAGSEARRSGPMTAEDLTALREEHVAFRARLHECRRRIDKLAEAMRELRKTLEEQVERSEEEKRSWKR